MMLKAREELYFSFFMGRLLGEHLRDALTQLRRQRRITKAALIKAEEMMRQYQAQVMELRAKAETV
jgi:pyruvate-formate lyase